MDGLDCDPGELLKLIVDRSIILEWTNSFYLYILNGLMTWHDLTSEIYVSILYGVLQNNFVLRDNSDIKQLF